MAKCFLSKEDLDVWALGAVSVKLIGLLPETSALENEPIYFSSVYVYSRLEFTYFFSYRCLLNL